MGGWNFGNTDIENDVARAIFMVLDPVGGAAKTMSLFGSDFAQEVEYRGRDEPEPHYRGANALLQQQALAGELQNGGAGTTIQPTAKDANVMDTKPSRDSNYLPGANKLLGIQQPNIYTWS